MVLEGNSLSTAQEILNGFADHFKTVFLLSSTQNNSDTCINNVQIIGMPSMKRGPSCYNSNSSKITCNNQDCDNRFGDTFLQQFSITNCDIRNACRKLKSNFTMGSDNLP